jgi:tetratricopeptide (TPR) repeat protein
MREMLEDLRETLAEFAEQPDWPMLVVRANDMAGGLVLQQLEAVESINDRDLFFRFPHPLDTTADDWTVKAMVSLKLDVERSNRVLAKTHPTAEPVAPTPTSVLDARLSIADRWRLAIRYMSEMLPNTDHHRLVVAAMPNTFRDPVEHAKLVGALMTVSHETGASHVRVMVRDPGAQLDPQLRRLGARFLTYDVDLSAAAMIDSLVRDAGNPATDTAQRMKALLQLAFIDHAHDRTQQALEKFGRLCTYYTIEKQPGMHAVALYGAALAMDKVITDKVKVRERFQSALALTIEAKSYPVMLEVLMAIVPVCLGLKEYEAAQSYADTASKIAKGTFHAGRYVEALVLRGDAELALERPAEARASWELAAETSEKAQCAAAGQPALERLARLFRQARMRTEERSVESRISLIPKVPS